NVISPAQPSDKAVVRGLIVASSQTLCLINASSICVEEAAALGRNVADSAIAVSQSNHCGKSPGRTSKSPKHPNSRYKDPADVGSHYCRPARVSRAEAGVSGNSKWSRISLSVLTPN